MIIQKCGQSTCKIIFEPLTRQKIANIRPLIIFRGIQTMYTSRDRTTILRLNATSIDIYEYQWTITISFLEISQIKNMNPDTENNRGLIST